MASAAATPAVPSAPPATAVQPVVAQTAAAAHQGAGSDPLGEGRSHMKVLYEGVQQIHRVLRLTGGGSMRTGCVSQRLAEARIGVQLGNEEIANLKASLSRKEATDSDRDERAHSLVRLRMLAERTRELVRAAETCADDDRSGIDVTQVQVEISPGITEDGSTISQEGSGRPAP